MAVVSAEYFANHLHNHPLSPLYVIHGEEELLRLECVDTLRAACKQQGFSERQVFYAENASSDWNELWMMAAGTSLFAELKLLEIHIPSGKPGKNGGEVLQSLAADLPADTVCLVVLPKLERAQQSAKWFTALTRVATVVEAKGIGATALPNWIRHRLQQHHLEIENDALTLFAERVEGNLLAAKQEIDKIVLQYPQGHCICLEEAAVAVANVARFDVFQLATAWMGQDAPRLARLLDGLEAEGEEPVLLLWALTEDIRTLIRLGAALKQGKTVAAVRNELRLWGEKQHLAPQALRRIGVAKLMDALSECARIDRQIKGAQDGSAWHGFKMLAMSLAT